jgi:hypothetical protein
VRVGQRQLLRHGTPERHAEHVGVGEAEGIEDVGGLAGQPVHALRDEPRRRFAGARRVVRDGLDPPADEGAFEGVPHLDVAAEAHDEQEWAALTRGGHPDEVAVDAHEREDSTAHWCTLRAQR